MELNWQSPPKNLAIKKEQIHLWRASIPIGTINNPKALSTFNFLNQEEQARALRFRFTKDQVSFTFCRGLLRTLLGRYLEKSPETIQFIYGKQNKPYLKLTTSSKALEKTLQFNLSHSHEKALFIFSKQTEVGIDLEKIEKEGPWPKLAEAYFAPEEIDFLKNLPPSQQNQAGYQLWTLKEAFLKAKGIGLSQSLDSFQITWHHVKNKNLDPNTLGPLVAIKSKKEKVSHLTLQSFTPFKNYIAGLVIAMPHATFELFDGDKFNS